MKTLIVRINSASAKQTFYAASNFGQLLLTASKKEAFSNKFPPLIAKVEIYSDSVFSTVEDMKQHYRNSAINALKKEGIINEFEKCNIN